MRWFYPGIICLFIVVVSFLLADVSRDQYERAHHVEYLFDNVGDSTIDSIQMDQFQQTQTKIPPLTKSVWLRIKVPPKVLDWTGDAVLYTGSNETALSMTGYIAENSKIHSLGFCDVRIEADECQVPTLQYAFPVKKEIQSADTWILLNIIPGASGVNNEFYFFKRSFFNRITILLTYFLGISTGVFLLVAIFSLFFYITFKELSFLIYSLFYANLLVSVTVNRGFWDAYRPSSISFTGTDLLLPVLLLTVFFDLSFLRVFFEMPKKNKNINKVFLAATTLILLAVLMALFPSTKIYAWKALSPIIFGAMILASLSLIYLIWEKRLWAESVAAGWVAAIACNIIWTLYRNGSIEGYWFFGYYAIFGRVLESLILNNVIFQKISQLYVTVGTVKEKNEESMVVKTLLRTLSHDLSNTTQVIKGSASVIAKNKSPEQIEKYLGYISSAAESQAEIIENAKKNYLVRGEKIISLKPTDLKKCVDQVVNTYRANVQKKNLSLQIEYPDENVLVFAEKSSLCHQVIANILSNAIKFSYPEKKIWIRVHILDEAWVELRIKDEGIGIPGHILDRMFDENQDISRPGTSGEIGTGSGLLIIKDFAKAFGGDFTIESSVDWGTEMILKLRRFN